MLGVTDLFPKGHTLADAYHEADSSPEFWRCLAEAQYVRGSPLYVSRQKHIPFIPDEPIPEKDLKQKHHTKNPVEVRAIAFFDKDGLDAARRSKERASRTSECSWGTMSFPRTRISSIRSRRNVSVVPHITTTEPPGWSLCGNVDGFRLGTASNQDRRQNL